MPEFDERKSGDKFKLTANELNWMLKAGDARRRSVSERPAAAIGSGLTSSGIIEVAFTESHSETSLNLFDVVLLDSPLYPVDSAEYNRRPLFKGSDVGSTVTDKHFGILLQPIQHISTDKGQIGAVMTTGIVQCRIKKKSNNHKFAKLLASDSTQLESSGAGPARIVWMESGNIDDTLNAVVQLGIDTGIEIGIGKLKSSLSVGGTVNVDVWHYSGGAFADRGDDISVKDWLMKTGATAMASGKKCIWMKLGSIYIFLEIECP